MLQISNQTNDEQISVYTLAGKQIASVRKKETTIQIDASSFPKGVLIVGSSAGWNSKIIAP
jgi:trans-2-enoyl-CoA reductase